jgi:hypothetical protein
MIRSRVLTASALINRVEIDLESEAGHLFLHLPLIEWKHLAGEPSFSDSVEANQIPPERWYPEGHKPELVREWPFTEDIEIPSPFADPE